MKGNGAEMKNSHMVFLWSGAVQPGEPEEVPHTARHVEAAAVVPVESDYLDMHDMQPGAARGASTFWMLDSHVLISF